MDLGATIFLLILGPASASGLYWMLYRYYRNTDKSHSFERETRVNTQSITGVEDDEKVSEVRGTQDREIHENNVGDFRKRVERIRP